MSPVHEFGMHFVMSSEEVLSYINFIHIMFGQVCHFFTHSLTGVILMVSIRQLKEMHQYFE